MVVLFLCLSVLVLGPWCVWPQLPPSVSLPCVNPTWSPALPGLLVPLTSHFLPSADSPGSMAPSCCPAGQSQSQESRRAAVGGSSCQILLAATFPSHHSDAIPGVSSSPAPGWLEWRCGRLGSPHLPPLGPSERGSPWEQEVVETPGSGWSWMKRVLLQVLPAASHRTMEVQNGLG